MDIYAEITNRIINQLEQGVIPWRKPWVACGAAISYATGKPYSLLNQMLLGKAGEYLTFKQVQNAGGRVRIRHSANRPMAAALAAELRLRFPGCDVRIAENRGICSFYAEKGGLLVGFEDAGAPEL